MKTPAPTLLLAALLHLTTSPTQLHAQGATLVYDEAHYQQAAANHTVLKNLMEQQLAKAEAQLQRLDTQLTRIGNYAETTNLPSTLATTEALARSQSTGLKTNQQLEDMNKAITGTEVFDDTASGLYQPIGAQVKDRTGKMVDRDPSTFKKEAALQAHIDEYKRIRAEALAEEQTIRQALADTLTAIDSAPDEASVLKQQALVTVLEGRLQESRDRLAQATRDVEMHEKEALNQERVQSLAKMGNKPAPTDPAGIKELATQLSGQLTNAWDNAKAAAQAKGISQKPKRLNWGSSSSSTSTAPTSPPTVP